MSALLVFELLLVRAFAHVMHHITRLPLHCLRGRCRSSSWMLIHCCSPVDHHHIHTRDLRGCGVAGGESASASVTDLHHYYFPATVPTGCCYHSRSHQHLPLGCAFEIECGCQCYCRCRSGGDVLRGYLPFHLLASGRPHGHPLQATCRQLGRHWLLFFCAVSFCLLQRVLVTRQSCYGKGTSNIK